MQRFTLLLVLLTLSALCLPLHADPPSTMSKTPIQQASMKMQEGLFLEALNILQPWMLAPKSITTVEDERNLSSAVSMVMDCMGELSRVNEADAFLERLVEVHPNRWRVLDSVADAYRNLHHWGGLVEDKFSRADGNEVSADKRDRIRALQLKNQAQSLLQEEWKNTEAANRPANEYGRFFMELAATFMEDEPAWKLQILTDWTILPDYEDDDRWWYGDDENRAPVDAEDNPILYHVPESFETAKNDGERWRWALAQAVEYDPSLLAETLNIRADFSRSQFGENTLQEFSFFRDGGGRQEAGGGRREEGIWNLGSLGDNEIIAQLATGLKRFELADEFHYIALYKEMVRLENRDWKSEALQNLANIALDRMQYEKAVDYLKQLIAVAKNEDAKEAAQKQLQQVVGHWGRIESTGSKVLGMDATLQYVFRNGKKVKWTAKRIDIPLLLNDIKSHIKTKPNQLDWNRLQIEQIGQWLIFGQEEINSAAAVQKKYLREQVAAWEVALEPAAKHFDRRIEVSVPIKKAGAYLVAAEMEDGNTEYIVLWLNDTAIVQKNLNGEVLYFLADARSGQPVASAQIDFFGYKFEWKRVPVSGGRQRQENRTDWTFRELYKKTDENGLLSLGASAVPSDFLWLVTAQGAEGRFAYLGFNGMWFSNRDNQKYHARKAFFISDRPVYRPKDKVEMKCWLGTARYDQPNVSEWAGKNVSYIVWNPKHEKILERSNVKLDEYGGLTEVLELPADATLGTYRFAIETSLPLVPNVRASLECNGTFMVEEYRKPEYEVSVDAPSEPVKLGDKIEATIKAKYYFGAPVTEAKVKYKVLREKHSADWFPPRPWDWFYGSGYGWLGSDAEWFPGWKRWGLCRPMPSWRPRNFGPPELVAEQEVEIGPDGTVVVRIDTSSAQAMYPDDDHKYSITAEVVDNSRQTIVGIGKVLVAKEPFRIYAWTQRGWYEPEAKIEAQFKTRRVDGKPVAGNGEVKLLRVTCEKTEEGTQVRETEVHRVAVQFDQDGNASVALSAAQAGQYRISCKIDEQEGGYLFNVHGKNSSPAATDGTSAWKFDDLELVPDQAEYAPGETVQLRVNSDQDNAFILFFYGCENGICNSPEILRLDGKSQQVSLLVEIGDMPNVFVEALLVRNGRVVNEIRELAVPPQERVLDIQVQPSSEKYKPGAKATAQLRVTDLDGTPVVGQTVVTIYDKSVEYVSGGSNIPDIKEYFWQWRRNHHPNTSSNLGKFWSSMCEPNKPSMGNLGIFGDRTAEEDSDMTVDRAMAPPQSRMMRAFAKGDAMGGGMIQEKGIAFRMAPMAAMENGIDAYMESDDAGGEDVQPTIRENFADTAFWAGALETNSDGIATIELDMPESLTTWKINVWAMGTGTRVGYGQAEVITSKDLILRMQMPRFLVEKDIVTLTANVHNYLSSEKEAKITLEDAGDGILEMVDTDKRTQTVRIPAGGEAKIDWSVLARKAGQTAVTMTAITNEESDAMRKTLPVQVHGILKQQAWSGYVAPQDNSGVVSINVPEERKPEQTQLTVRFSPSLAASMLDALPYLVDYPYGCTEQTLNRFLPTVIVQKILQEGNIDLAQLAAARANLNAQELGEDRKPGLARRITPIYDPAQVYEMASDGVTHLTNMQCSDGGWGWFGGYGSRSSAHLTPLVVHGLRLAVQNDVAVDENVIRRGEQWLVRYQKEEVQKLENALLEDAERKNKPWKTKADANDAFVMMVLSESNVSGAMDTSMKRMRELLWRDRGSLSPYAVAMYGIGLGLRSEEGDAEKIDTCIKMLGQYLVQDEENQTAWLELGRSSGIWWYWYGSEFETQAYYLKLLMRTNPTSPVAPRLVKYLLNNRRYATYWNSTRDTAICIEAFAEFLRATGESKPAMDVEVLFDGTTVKSVSITPENMFLLDYSVVLEAEQVSTGPHKVELRKKGSGPLYFNVYLENFTLEDPIEKTGLEVKIERRFYRLDQDTEATTAAADSRGNVRDLKTLTYRRVALDSAEATLNSGDLIEVELIIESKNDYESILIEDRKAAGLEPVEIHSGYTGNSLGAYVEFRDDRVAMFVERLPKGRYSTTYRLRAETPGRFSALPTSILGMYAPELKGNSDENKVKVSE